MQEFYSNYFIQVTYASDRIEEREIEGLLEAKNSLKVDNSVILTWDCEGKVKGIRALQLWRLLLE